MGNTMRNTLVILALVILGACTPSETKVSSDFGFDGTCTNCHLGLSGQHTHPNFKLRCIDCHGGNYQVVVPPDACCTNNMVLMGSAAVAPGTAAGARRAPPPAPR